MISCDDCGESLSDYRCDIIGEGEENVEIECWNCGHLNIVPREDAIDEGLY